ncbi:MAG: glycoside hydrolase family 65 protein [Ruminococcaceae bacterium]|nr:glycoside hydrolase family 65 protein [Oscillospiraceae bacterium]
MSKWILTSDKPDLGRMRKHESIWTQGNGYMGVRASFEEAYTKAVRNTLINGVFDCPKGEVPELAVIPDATNCDITLDKEVFNMICGKVDKYEASLNMENGEFTRLVEWTCPKGKKYALAFSRIVSDARKHIMAQKVSVTPLSDDADVELLTGLDGKVTNSGVQHFNNPEKRAYPDGVKGMYLTTLQSKVDVAIHFGLKISHECNEGISIDRRGLYSRLSRKVQKGETFTVEKIVSYAHSRDFEYADGEYNDEKLRSDGRAYLNEAIDMGYDKLLEESSLSWKNFWESSLVDVKSGNDFVDKAVVFSQYHLHIMASHDDNRLGIGAKALSGEGYMGHSFWDTEIYILPYYLCTQPRVARRLLEYRYMLLPVAKNKANRFGFKGAMYPWESAWITDGEACLEYGDIDLLTGKKRKFMMAETEIHITAGVSFAVWQYYCMTGDEEFMAEYGNEILVRTAIFWADRAEKKNGRYEICGVIGADEYKEDVDNNAYTNYMAHKNLVLADKILRENPNHICNKLSREYDMEDMAKKIAEVAENLYLPMPEEDGIINQFDGVKSLKPKDITYYKNLDTVFDIFKDYGLAEILEMAVFKQADLVMLFYLMSDKFDKETIRKNFEYYEERTLHDSSLSMCIHALVAVGLGMNEMADKFFYDCLCVDLGENTNNSDTGIHSASIGGIWLATVMGYGGLRINDSGISISPILPQGWESYSFPIYYRGSKIKVFVDKAGCRAERVSGDEITITLNGNKTTI